MRYASLLILFLSISVSTYCQKQFVLNSAYLNSPDTVWIFTPTDYTDNKQMPVTYLLHGWSGKYWHWDYMIDCQEYADNYNTIIVCPDGLYDSWYINSPLEEENRYESFFILDLIPLIEKNYNVNKDSIFITGLSMGGHGALYLCSKTPGYFSKVGSLSGLLDLRNWQNHYGISRVLGLGNNHDNKSVLWSYSVISNIDAIKSLSGNIIVSCGTEDPFYNINIEFINQCDSKGLSTVFKSASGGHNAQYWTDNVVDHFEFFFR